MQKWIINQQHRTKLKLLLLFSLMAACLLYSCTKTDFSNTTNLHDADFVKKFFTIKQPVNSIVAKIIEKLKVENERTGFVNRLPNNCGLPLWDKIVSQKVDYGNNFGPGDSTNEILIPLTITNQNLSSLLEIKELVSGLQIDCYKANEYLYELCHTINIDTAKANNDLLVFFYMENITFGTTEFYHIPDKLIPESNIIDADGNKTVMIENVLPPIEGRRVMECVWNLCSVCGKKDCPSSFIDCGYVGTLGSGSGSGSTGNNGNGSTGSGTSGSGSGGGNGCPWYICGNSPSTNPPDTILNPCAQLAILKNNPVFKAMLQNLKDSANDINSNTEHAYIYDYTPSSLALSELSGNPGDSFINYTLTSKLDGFAHDHYTGLLSVYSPKDLADFCQIFNDNLMTDSSTFTFPLLTKNGPPYILMIENVTKFRKWAKIMEGSAAKASNKFESDYNIRKLNTVEENEKGFLNFLKKYLKNLQSGIKVFRGNSDYSEWTPLGLNNNGEVISTPCPSL